MTLVGMPPEVIGQLRESPWWSDAKAIAPTLAYDSEVMGDASRGGTVPAEQVGRVRPAALVLVGGASPAWMIDTARRIVSSRSAWAGSRRSSTQRRF